MIEGAVLLSSCVLDTLTSLKDKHSVDKLLFDIIVLDVFTVVDFSAYKACNAQSPPNVTGLAYNIHLAQPSASLSYKITFTDSSAPAQVHPSNTTFRDLVRNLIEYSGSSLRKQRSASSDRQKRRNLVLILADKKKQKVTVDVDNPLCVRSRPRLP